MSDLEIHPSLLWKLLPSLIQLLLRAIKVTEQYNSGSQLITTLSVNLAEYLHMKLEMELGACSTSMSLCSSGLKATRLWKAISTEKKGQAGAMIWLCRKFRDGLWCNTHNFATPASLFIWTPPSSGPILTFCQRFHFQGLSHVPQPALIPLSLVALIPLWLCSCCPGRLLTLQLAAHNVRSVWSAIHYICHACFKEECSTSLAESSKE